MHTYIHACIHTCITSYRELLEDLLVERLAHGLVVAVDQAGGTELCMYIGGYVCDGGQQ